MMAIRSGQAKLWVYAVLAMTLTACAPPPMTTVILVRHAERPSGADPGLLPEGQARAESLAVALARTKVDAILHTQFQRTMQTAAARRAEGATPIVLNAAGPESVHAQEVVDRINTLRGRTIVYVGHSNTVPSLIRRLGIVPPPPIADSEYSLLFIVTQKRGEPASLIRAKYGK
jgi:broad specificity phosphatase PhoE